MDIIHTALLALLPYLWILLGSIVVAGVAYCAVRLGACVNLTRQKVSYLELTPPAREDKIPEATEQLFLALHNLVSSVHFYDRILARRTYTSFEIVSTRKEGIKYVVRCKLELSSTIEQIITSYAPDIHIKKIDDYLEPKKRLTGRVICFKQSGHFAYPLKDYRALSDYDSISYLTSAMTKLDNEELIAVQLVMSPYRVHGTAKLIEKIMSNSDLRPKIESSKANWLNKVSKAANTLVFLVSDLLSSASASASQSTTDIRIKQKEMEYNNQVARRIKPARSLSRFEQEFIESIYAKLRQHFFRVDIRVLIDVRSRSSFKARRAGIKSALNLYGTKQYQRLDLKTPRGWLSKTYSRWMFKKRLPSVRVSSGNILAISEVASLYHFPHTISARGENVVRSLSKTLPAPLSLKNGASLSILIGQNIHHGQITPIGLSSGERQRHVYVIGGTGNGKTTMLLYMIVQDIKNGKGVAVIDPHGDLAEDILRYIPQERRNDVIYFNPDDLSRPIGVNLLELTPGLSGDELLREKDLVTESVISIFRKVFSEDDSGGHRIEYILRNTIQTALTIEGSTLFTIFRLLNDRGYSNRIVRGLEDEDLKNFWKNEINKAGDFQKVKMAAGITSKVGRFLFSAPARRVLEQEKSTIDFSGILDSSKILICNFSKGLIGEDTSALFGTTVLAKLQIAALRRARTKEGNREPFYLYVDEFQNFATMSFVQMLSEARKYKLFLVMAQQSTSQQDKQRLVDIILANVGTVVSFRSGSPADERYILPLFNPYIKIGEIANLPAYGFYVRISALVAQEPLSGSTVLIEQEKDESGANQVKTLSREKYGRNVEEDESRGRDTVRVDSPSRENTGESLTSLLRHTK